MRRLALYLGCALPAALLLLAAGLYWLVGTTSGARFALTALSRPAGLQLSVGTVEGRLLDHLRLGGVRVTQPKLTARIDSLEITWQPRRLLSRDLSVSELTASGVRIQDDRVPGAKAAPHLSWPRVSGAARRFSAEISRLKLSALSYRRMEEPPVLLTELSSSLGYRDGMVTLAGLSAVSPQGRVSGEMVAGLVRPSLRLDLALVPAQPLQGMDLFSLQARLVPGRDPEQIAGSIAAAGRSGGAQRLEITGELGMTANTFLLRKLNLARPGRHGTLTGEGSLTLTRGEPLLALALQGTDLDLLEELKRPTRLTGTLSFSGSPSRYQGKFALENRGPGWQSASLAAEYRGGKTGLTLAPIAGNLLDGRLNGSLDVAWSEGVQLRGALSGRGLDPKTIAPDWSGRINLDLAGNLEIPEKGSPRGKVNGRLLESRLHGEQLQGELLAAFAGDRLRVDRLLLRGKGFDLRGAGELDRRLDLVARVDDLSRLVPGAAGRLQADAWVRWRDRRLSGGASGEGGKLAVNGMRVAAVQLSARLGEGKGYPVHLEATLSGLSLGRVQADAATLTVDGTASRHVLEAKLTAPGGEALASLTGGYQGGFWRGELTRLSGRDSVGPWGLAAPAPLVLSAGKISLSPLLLRGAPAERVEIAGELTRHPLSGFFRGGWGGVNLARANSWLKGVEVAGGSSGELNLRLLPGERLLLAGRAEAQGRVVTDGRSITLERVAAVLDGNSSGLKAALDLSLSEGAGQAHLLFESRAPATLSLPRQGDLTMQWSDLDLVLLRPVVPENLKLDGRFAGVATGKLLPGGRLDLKGNAALAQGHLNWRGEAEELDASVQQAELAFGWRGGKGAGGRLKLTGQAAATGAFTAQGNRTALERFALRLDADQSGTRAALDRSVQGGGTLRGRVSSASPAGLPLPETGQFALEWGGIDPALLKPWLPGALNLEGGRLKGQASGRLLPGRRLELDGEAEFSQGRASWQGEGGEMNANLRSASLAFAWRGATLTGGLTLALAEYGSLQGRVLLPVPARLPVAANPEGALQGFLTGRIQERGFLTSLFPGLVQESHGDLDVDLRLGGVWREPRMQGRLTLAKAGAYLPTAGIRVSDLQLTASLEQDGVRIESFRAVSGKGHIEGTALVRLKGWQVAGYSGTLNGERFQTVDLPELKLSSSPKLSFEGDAERLTVAGELLIPEMVITGPPARSVVSASKDVVLEGATAPEAKQFPLEVEGRIRLVLGDKVLVKAEGIDAQLGGEMDLVLKGIDSITSRGEIRVVKGRYRAFGVDLEIVRGRLYYVDGPVDQPTLDILALRTVLDVRAGVTVAGPLGEQIVKLYSEPSMPEVDILAYMVLGHPLGSSSEQGSLVSMAASSLFSLGQSESLQEQIKDRLGLSVLGVETVDQSSAGRMGYKEIPVSPTGVAQARPSAGESLLTVGKYLTPKLYLSYGRSLVTGGNLFQLRYDILRHWQVETQSGSESGVDLYYKLEFN